MAVRLLIIADDANTVMDVVDCGCELHPLAETTNRIPAAIVCFNRPRIGPHHICSRSSN
jgi:hypothetical protein